MGGNYFLCCWCDTILFNLVDGLDGLAGSIAFVAFSTFALHAAFGGNSILMLLNLAFAGAVLGFLRFNWTPSTVFMGDAGSLCLGFVLAYMAIVMTQGVEPITRPVVPLLILAVPITDTIVVMTRRVLHGHSPFQGRSASSASSSCTLWPGERTDGQSYRRI